MDIRLFEKSYILETLRGCLDKSSTFEMEGKRNTENEMLNIRRVK